MAQHSFPDISTTQQQFIQSLSFSRPMSTSSSIAKSNPNSIRFHDYCSFYSTSDTVLSVSSSDGAIFRVHSIIMQMASGVFKNMLDGARDTGEAVPLEEKGDVVKALLDVIHPNGKSIELNGRPFEFVWSLLAAADKYDVRKVTDEIRVRLLSDPYFKSYPLESYAIACRYDWSKERVSTTAGALDNINAPQSWKIFTQLNAIHVMRLHKLIAMRREFVSKEVKDHASYGIYYSNEYSHKETLSSLVQQEIMNCPSGSTLRDKFWTREDLRRILTTRGIEELKRRFNENLKHLPSDAF